MCTKICPDIIIKASIKVILVTLLLTLKMFFSINTEFWKTPSSITFKNLGSLRGKYLWCSSLLVTILPLQFTVILPMILETLLWKHYYLWLWFYETLLWFYEPCLVILVSLNYTHSSHRKEKILFSCNIVFLWLCPC